MMLLKSLLENSKVKAAKKSHNITMSDRYQKKTSRKLRSQYHKIVSDIFEMVITRYTREVITRKSII